MAVTVKGVTTLKSSTALGGLVPTLNLDFTTPSGIGLNPLNPLVTFSRADAGPYATVTGSDGYLRRAAHNIALYSQDFSNAAWAAYSGASKVGVAGSVSPDGTSNAYEVALGTNGGTFNLASGVYQNLTFAASTTYTISMWVRAKTGSTTARLGMNVGASYDSGDVAVTTSWQRISVTGASSGSGSGNISIRTNVAGNSANVFVYGAQLEQNITPSYYVPTTSAAVYSTPRFDYNPTTLAPLGLLVEESRANLLTYSEQFDNAAWSIGGILAWGSGSIANNAVSPDGTTTADKAVEDTSTGLHRTFRSFSATSGSSYAFTVYAKAAGRSVINTAFGGAGMVAGSASFDLSAGTVSNVTSATASITSIGNGWYRCSLVAAAAATNTGLVYVNLTNGTSTSYTGDGTSGVLLWGAQLEAGSFATSYIPTTTASVTRAADVASVTGTNFSSWYNQSEGSVVASSIYNSAAMGSGRILSIYDNSNNRAQDLFYLPGTTVIASYSNYTGYGGQLTMGSTSASTTQKGGLAYKVNNGNMFLNGAARGVINPLTIDVTPTKMQIGNYANSSYLNGTVAYIKYWNTRLTDAQLQAITT